MWISNTATTAMMIAIVQAVIKQLEEEPTGSVESGSSGAVNDGYDDVETGT